MFSLACKLALILAHFFDLTTFKRIFISGFGERKEYLSTDRIISAVPMNFSVNSYHSLFSIKRKKISGVHRKIIVYESMATNTGKWFIRAVFIR
ncbi:hypothetical protein D8M09_02745 [Enterobacter sp. R1(2018)]|nr:hypothetical protein D8M09_02745 [Enterobacter sp. R1(2018)]